MPHKKTGVITDEKRVDEVLTRGVAEILPSRDALKQLLMSGKRIKLYQGFDPTGTQLHIGHMVGLRKLRQFQDLGHEVVFLIGDGTGQAGDPSGKLKARDTYFSHQELLKNANTYMQQVQKIIRFTGSNPVQILFNGTWLNKLRLKDILEIASNFTLQQLSERDLFQERIQRREAVNLREFLYPLLQGYDSVAMNVDLEIGATDQIFNMLTGRLLVRRFLNKEKFVLATPLLTDTLGRKIGKTEGNVIALTDAPEDLYGKIMALGDDIIIKGLEYLTNVPTVEIQKIEEKLHSSNPKIYKERLAFEVVAQLHGVSAGEKARKSFIAVFTDKQTPENMKEVPVKEGLLLDDVLQTYGIVSSKSEGRRLATGGAITDLETGRKITSIKIPLTKPVTLKIGKKLFIRIQITKTKKNKKEP